MFAHVIQLFFVASLFLWPVYWLFDPLDGFERLGYWPVLIPVGLGVLYFRLRKKGEAIPQFVQLGLSFFVPFLALLGAEFALAKSGFSYPLSTIVIKGKSDTAVADDTFMIWDPELLWKLNPGAEYNGRRVNQMGFFDREVDPVKASNTVRVICMGDSCVGQGNPAFSFMLHEKLQEEPPGGKSWEAFNMGVHGYSSAQGLRLFAKEVKALAPDFVTIQYGWNDHWQGKDPDKVRMSVKMREGLAWSLVKKLQEKTVCAVFGEKVGA